MQASRLRRSFAVALALLGFVAGAGGAFAGAAPWRLDASFGKRGIARLPFQEEGIDSQYPPGPGEQGSLLASGPQQSVFVGGYQHRKKGSLLVAQLSARGQLVRGFGRGGVTVVPAIYSTPQTPARMLALPGGELLVVGLNRADRFTVARLTARGQTDRSFGHDGVAQYKLAGAHGHAIIAAAASEPDGDILAAYYPAEVAQPVNEPRIAPGLGQGPIELVRLLGSGALDRSFGRGGFLKASGQPPATGHGFAVGVTIPAQGSILVAYESVIISGSNFTEVPAVQELTPTGLNDSSFGDGGVALLPFVPTFEGASSSIFGALFALPDGSLEVSFGGGGQLFRFTEAGALDPTFATSGHTGAGSGASAFALAPDGETFSVDDRAKLTVTGTLPSGAADPALRGSQGERLAANLPRLRPSEEQQALALLAADHGVSILVGEEIVHLAD